MKRKIAFNAELQQDPDGGVLATFPDVPEAITYGGDLEDAIRSAQEALAVALFGYLKEGRPIPILRRKSGLFVAPQPTDVLKIAVVDAWMGSGLSKSEFARMLDVNEKEAGRILDPDTATKADRLEGALSVLGRKVHVAVEAA